MFRLLIKEPILVSLLERNAGFVIVTQLADTGRKTTIVASIVHAFT
jgi:Tfp pilus assembly pilus retraction ATPase PilT